MDMKSYLKSQSKSGPEKHGYTELQAEAQFYI